MARKANRKASMLTTRHSIGKSNKPPGKTGHTSSSWTPAIDNRKNEVIKIKFSTTDCQVCPSRSLCTQSIRHTRRTVTIRPEAQYQAGARRDGNKKRPRNLSKPMPSVPVLREPSRKEFGSWVYVVPAILARRKRICNMLLLLPLSTWFGVWHGLSVFHALRLDVLLLFASTMRLKWVRQRYQSCGRTSNYVKRHAGVLEQRRAARREGADVSDDLS